MYVLSISPKTNCGLQPLIRGNCHLRRWGELTLVHPHSRGHSFDMNSGPNSSFATQQTLSTLPLELIHALDQAYLLHLLATDPESVLPPGKTPLSMLAHAQVGLPDKPSGRGDQDTALLGRVKEVAHKAFWTEVCSHFCAGSETDKILFLIVGPRSPVVTHPLCTAASFEVSIWRYTRSPFSPFPSQSSDSASIVFTFSSDIVSPSICPRLS